MRRDTPDFLGVLLDGAIGGEKPHAGNVRDRRRCPALRLPEAFIGLLLRRTVACIVGDQKIAITTGQQPVNEFAIPRGLARRETAGCNRLEYG